MSNRTVVSDVADAIAFRIVSGKYAIGEHLPGVRKLATEFDINPSTVQVVLARLESSGFVSSRPGSGFTVKDIEQFGGIPTWKYLFRFAQQIPDRAVRIYQEILDFRTLIIIDALKRVAKNPGRYPSATVRKAVEQLELVMETRADDYVEISRAQIHALRSLHIATEQTVITSVLNSISEVYLEVPAVMQSMTARPEVHTQMWQALIKAWDSNSINEKYIAETTKLLQHYDEFLLKHFRKIVTDPKYKAEIPEDKVRNIA